MILRKADRGGAAGLVVLGEYLETVITDEHRAAILASLPAWVRKVAPPAGGHRPRGPPGADRERVLGSVERAA